MCIIDTLLKVIHVSKDIKETLETRGGFCFIDF